MDDRFHFQLIQSCIVVAMESGILASFGGAANKAKATRKVIEHGSIKLFGNHFFSCCISSTAQAAATFAQLHQTSSLDFKDPCLERFQHALSASFQTAACSVIADPSRPNYL